MNTSEKELVRRISIINELGLHARPAALISKLAKNAKYNVWIVRDKEKVDATSIIDILSLACLKGTEITLQVDDRADIDILDQITALAETGFKEKSSGE
ncbi:MAG: HPr family phosphocarrier protein [Deltaproteobacteria bacterium]|nr:HPr family phosphocarrier protein [Deltaproteobacteria bacterium]